MLRRAALLLALALVVAGCGGTTASGREATPEPGPRVLFAGDSIAEDYYASSADRGFVSLVTEALDATPVRASLSGARSWRIAERVTEVMADEEPVDIAVLEVGANDVGKSTIERWRQWYGELLAAVAARSPDAEVVCLGPWGPPGPTAPYDAVVAVLCSDQVFVRLSDFYAEPEMRGPEGSATPLGPRDWFHPNDEGHAAIAERVEAALPSRS